MQRKKLWQLDSRFHCPVIGTCLTLEELRHIARKAGISVGSAMTDYELHHSFVRVAGEPLYVTRLAHKWLDRKFDSTIRRFRACRIPATLDALWEQAMASGDVAGAFWAVLTLPAAPEALVQRIYGDVHMLSHLVGHANRTSREEVEALRRRVAELAEALDWTAQAARLRIQGLERRAAELEGRVREVEPLRRELAAAQARLAELENGEALARLQAANASLTAQARQALERARTAEREMRTWKAVPCDTAPRLQPPDRREPPPAAPERCPASCDAIEAGDCPGPDLCGRRILYVGGRNRQVAHFRMLVERRSGEFLHHDGGLTESAARLPAMIRSADVVLCPVDCVSHDACLRIKRLCKRTAKPFVVLKNASLTSFSEGIRAITG